MKRNRYLLPILAIFLLVAASLACSLPFKIVPNIPTEESAPVEEASGEEEAVVAEESEDEPQPPPTETPEPTPTPPVVHMVFPGEPGGSHSWVIDTSTKGMSETAADLFNTNHLERPFTSQAMQYLAHVDLVRVNLNVSSPWIYTTFILEGSPPTDSTAIYALEIDLESDGTGDWLMFGTVPNGTEWTTEGAKAYQDLNNDVGGISPMNADVPNPAWDGYETLVFEDYFGADPDAVWIRRDPSNPNQVQLAVKHSLIGNDNHFAYGGWADDGLKDPGSFDYNDAMTFDQAGSPYTGSSKYPVKELASVDNTCRWTYGYDPTTPFPGLCPLPPTPVPNGSISGGVWNDMNGNGNINSGEPGISGVTVRLGAGACGSTGLGNRSTGGDGSFIFEDLPPGTYCVSVNINTSCGGWLSTTGGHNKTVTLSAGEVKLINWFGYARYVC